jgi:tetratricopeptide (TPR) repeat protein
MKAQDIVDNRVEINIIEADLYIAMNRLEDARAILDVLQEEDYIDCDIARSEMRYWEKKKEIKRVAEWYKKAHGLARSEPEQFSLLNHVAGVYFMGKMYPQALKAYQAIVNKDPTDHWAWHNMSVIHLRSDDLKQAAVCNDHALKLMDFGAAQKVRETIKKRSSLSHRLSDMWKKLSGK